VGHAPKVGQNELDFSGMCEWDRNFQRCYRYVLFNNLVLSVPKMGHMSKSGPFPKCEVVLVFFFVFLHFLYLQRNLGVDKLLSVSKMGQIS